MPSHTDLLAAFELPPDLMTTTFEHAISDDADSTHEYGHAVAGALARQLAGSTVEFGFPGIVTAYLVSGAVAHCGGPDIGWMIDIDAGDDAEQEVLDVTVPASERDPVRVATILAGALKGW